MTKTQTEFVLITSLMPEAHSALERRLCVEWQRRTSTPWPNISGVGRLTAMEFCELFNANMKTKKNIVVGSSAKIDVSLLCKLLLAMKLPEKQAQAIEDIRDVRNLAAHSEDYSFEPEVRRKLERAIDVVRPPGLPPRRGLDLPQSSKSNNRVDVYEADSRLTYHERNDAIHEIRARQANARRQMEINSRAPPPLPPWRWDTATVIVVLMISVVLIGIVLRVGSMFMGTARTLASDVWGTARMHAHAACDQNCWWPFCEEQSRACGWLLWLIG